jgi:hypothetical protein
VKNSALFRVGKEGKKTERGEIAVTVDNRRKKTKAH